MSDQLLQQCFSAYASNSIFQKTDPVRELYVQLRGKHIPIEGIPGCGKSTLGRALAERLNGLKIPAQYNNEIVLKGLLSLFYSEADKRGQTQDNTPLESLLAEQGTRDPAATALRVRELVEGSHRTNPYALTLQVFMLSICQNHHNEAMLFTGARSEGGGCGVAFTERAVFGNAVFAALQYQSGGMNDAEWDAYKEALHSRPPYSSHCVLFLHVTPAVALHRIKRLRRRESEQTIPIEYLIDLERAYYSQIYHQMVAEHSYVIIVGNEPYNDADQILRLICAHPPPYKFSPAEHPGQLSAEGVAAAFQRMCDHYESFLTSQ
jgi:deoxyadenosine/deoxycytidine kinase